MTFLGMGQKSNHQKQSHKAIKKATKKATKKQPTRSKMGNCLTIIGCATVVFVTDIKTDDAAAFILTYIWAACVGIKTIHVVVTNILHDEEAMAFLATVELIIRDRLAKAAPGFALPRVTFTASGEKPTKAKSHEPMFFNGTIKKCFEGEINAPITMEDLKAELAKGGQYMTFVYAPHTTLDCITKGPNAVNTFCGFGYNSKGMKTKDVLEWPGLYGMNNCSPHIYNTKMDNGENEEGGRFDAHDTELWNAFDAILPGFSDIVKQCALPDSIAFIGRQMVGAVRTLEIDIGLTEEDIVEIVENVNSSENPELDARCIKLVNQARKLWEKAVNIIENEKDHPKFKEMARIKVYIGRIIAQLDFNGMYGKKSTGVQVELTDAQHAALWLTEKHTKDVTIFDHEDGYIAFGPPDDNVETILAPAGITLADTRAAVLEILGWVDHAKSRKRGSSEPASPETHKKQLKIDTDIPYVPKGPVIAPSSV